MKVNTSTLYKEALDWAVAKCEGMSIDMLSEFDESGWIYHDSRRYSLDWTQGGQIIEREKIQLSPQLNGRQKGNWAGQA